MPEDRQSQAREEYQAYAAGAVAWKRGPRQRHGVMEPDDLREASDHAVADDVLTPNDEALSAPECRTAFSLFPNLRQEEWRSVHLVRPGERLRKGATYLDLRELGRGAFVATGAEIGSAISLLVAQNDVDPAIWNKLTGWIPKGPVLFGRPL